MASTETNSSTASLTECRICNERYTDTRGVHIPRRFPCCGNVICHQCAGALIETSSAARINCAYCRSSCDARRPEDLQLCRVTLNLLDSLCVLCQENINTSSCPHCTDRFCSRCLPQHSSDIRQDIESFFKHAAESLEELQSEEEQLHLLAEQVRESLASLEQRGVERVACQKEHISEKVVQLRVAVEDLQTREGGIEAVSPRSLPRVPDLELENDNNNATSEETILFNTILRLCNSRHLSPSIRQLMNHEDLLTLRSNTASGLRNTSCARLRQRKPEAIDMLQVASTRLPGDARFMTSLPDGRLAISCLNQHRVMLYKLDGTRLTADGELTHPELDGPEGVAASNEYFVVACGSNSFRGVLCFSYPAFELVSRQGGPQSHSGHEGMTAGSFSLPLGLAIDEARGLVYVADCLDERIQVLSLPELEPVEQFGASQLSQPWDVDIDEDLVFVTHDHGVAVFDAADGYAHRSSFSCGLRPHGCHVDRRYQPSVLLVCDRWGKLIRVIDEDGHEVGSERLCGGERPYSITELNGSLLITARGDDNNWRCITLWTTT